MDAQAHQPGEELADFTENELLSLIDAGTAGAYSEIYRRYRDDAVATASSSLPPAKARQVTDDAFLTVLRSLLNGSADTAEGLRSMVDAEIDAHLANSTTADPTSANGSDSFGDVPSADPEAPEAAQVSQALSALPDNWQRILWLREVERLPPEAVAKQLNIKASAVGRLADRAHQGLRDEWQKVRPTDSQATVDHRAALIPALLTSPIVIERLSNALAQAQPESAHAVAETAVTNTAAVEEPASTKPEAETTVAEATDVTGGAAGAKDEDTTTAVLPGIVAAAGAGTVIGNAPALNPAAGAEAAPETETEPEAHTAPEATPAAADSTGASAGTADDTDTVEPVSLAAFGAQSAATQTSTRAPAATRFSMPKPVLIPVVAACIGLLGTLVGVAVVPQNDEQAGIRPGNGSTAVSPADSSSKKEDKNSSSQSPAGTNSDKQDHESGSEKSRASDSDRDEDEKSSRSPGHDDTPSDDSSSTEDQPGDTGDKGDSNDRPSAKEPDNPSPSDSDEPDTESPSEPEPTTPDEPDDPSDEPPSETEDPEPTEPPATEPPPSDEPTDPSPTEEPSSPEQPSEEPSPTQGGSSSAPSTSN